MPGLAGIVNLDGRPADPAIVESMARAIAFRGRGGVEQQVVGSFGVAVLRDCLPRSLPAVPDGEAPGRHVAVLDGRTDNIAELRRRLGPRGDSIPDADVVVLLHDLIGDDALAMIEGDFAIVWFDRTTRTLTCARDTWGVRPLVYTEIGTTLAFASEVAALRSVPGFDAAPDESMVAELLALDIRSAGSTLYRRVRRLEPAHVLRVGPDNRSLRRYWHYDPSRALRLSADSEYSRQFLSRFSAAVAARLDRIGVTACEVSGGVDSSSVTSMAWRESGGSVAAFSLAFPGMSCDESEWSTAVARFIGVTQHFATPRPRSAEELEREALELADAPDLPHGAMHRCLYETVAQQGGRTLLTGLGGDDWFQGSTPVRGLAEALYEWRVCDAAREADAGALVSAARVLASESPAGPSLRAIVGPFRKRGGIAGVRPPWVTEDFWKRSGAAELLSGEFLPLRGSPARLETLRNATAPWSVWALERAERLAARSGVELHHPLLDRRLREFALALPEAQRVRGGVTKVVVRNAMRGLLPETVRTRSTKTAFTAHILSELRAPGVAPMLEALSIEQKGWVAGDWLRARHAVLCEEADVVDPDDLSALWALAMTLVLEAWNRSLGG